MRFIHTADLHIDQPFSGIVSDHVEVKELLKNSNQQVLTRIVDRCIAEQVDFLLVVGDTFHQNQPTIHTQKFVMSQFERLAQEDIPVILSFGNHDYYTENRYWFEWPENVILFKREEVQTKTIALKNGDTVAISGFSYEHQWVNRSMVPDYPKRSVETTYHIGFYHGDDSENYAPFSVSELPLSYEYWALGHIHKAEVISERPFAVYPGTPQGHTKKENQTKGVALIEITRGGRDIQWLDVATIQWQKQAVSLLEDLSRQALLQALETEILGIETDKHLSVVSIELDVSAENGRELLKEKEEILSYLQEMVYQKSQHKIWLKELILKKTESDKLIMGFETTLIDDLGRLYQAPIQFEKVVKGLLQQPGIASNLTWSEEDIVELVSESSQLIKDKMIFKNEAEQ